MINFTRDWVRRQMAGFWEEMVGIRPVLPARILQQTTPNVGPTNVDLDYAHKWIPFSELRTAKLIQLQVEDRLTYAGAGDKGDWYFWNDVYHQREEAEIVGDWLAEEFAEQVSAAINAVNAEIELEIQRQVAAGGNEDTIRKNINKHWAEHRKFEKNLWGHNTLKSVKNRFRVQCTKPASYFSDDRRWLVCQNGVIDLEGFRKTRKILPGNFHAHSPNRPVTRAVECSFTPGDPTKMAPTWYHFLETSIPDEEVRAFLQRLVGAAFMAESKVKAIPNLQGPRDCGKTIFVSTLERLAGEYGIQPSPDALMQTPGGTNFEQDTLRGARFVGVSEPSTTKKLDDTFCKQVTGGDEVRTRTLNRQSSPWLAQCVMFIASNHPVRFNTTDTAFLDRICLVKFPHQFYDPEDLPEDEWHVKDYELEEKLSREYEGILLWIIIGMAEYLHRGIDKPESVKMAGEAYAMDSAVGLAWVKEKVEEGLLMVATHMSDHPKSSYALTGELYREYAIEATMNGERPVGKRTFTQQLQGMFGEEVNSAGRRIPRLIGVGRYEGLKTKDGLMNAQNTRYEI